MARFPDEVTTREHNITTITDTRNLDMSRRAYLETRQPMRLNTKYGEDRVKSHRVVVFLRAAALKT